MHLNLKMIFTTCTEVNFILYELDIGVIKRKKIYLIFKTKMYVNYKEFSPSTRVQNIQFLGTI